MLPRKAQVNFLVDARLKMVYDRAKRLGHRVSRYCAAGLLLLLEDTDLRDRAMQRLVEWEDGLHSTLPCPSGDPIGLSRQKPRRAREGTSS